MQKQLLTLGALVLGFTLAATNARAETAFQTAQESAAVVDSICTRYPYVSQTQACYKNLSNARFSNESVTLCRKYPYLQQVENCLTSLRNMRFPEAALRACDRYPYVQQVEDCYRDVGTRYRNHPRVVAEEP